MCLNLYPSEKPTSFEHMASCSIFLFYFWHKLVVFLLFIGPLSTINTTYISKQGWHHLKTAKLFEIKRINIRSTNQGVREKEKVEDEKVQTLEHTKHVYVTHYFCICLKQVLISYWKTAFTKQNEALESVMCDVIKIRLKWRDATRSEIK